MFVTTLMTWCKGIFCHQKTPHTLLEDHGRLLHVSACVAPANNFFYLSNSLCLLKTKLSSPQHGDKKKHMEQEEKNPLTLVLNFLILNVNYSFYCAWKSKKTKQLLDVSFKNFIVKNNLVISPCLKKKYFYLYSILY